MFKDLKEKISKRDLIFGFIIIQLIEAVILVSVWRADAGVLINQISLGSSIASIILAFLAIIYAFIQSNEATRNSFSMQEILKTISNKVAELSRIEDTLTLLRNDMISSRRNIVQAISTIKTSFNSLKKDVQDMAEEKGEDQDFKTIINHIEEISEDTKKLEIVTACATFPSPSLNLSSYSNTNPPAEFFQSIQQDSEQEELISFLGKWGNNRKENT